MNEELFLRTIGTIDSGMKYYMVVKGMTEQEAYRRTMLEMSIGLYVHLNNPSLAADELLAEVRVKTEEIIDACSN